MSAVADLAEDIAARRQALGAETYIVGVTGGVAAGKSTLATALAEAFAAREAPLVAEVVGSDGFLFSNAVLAERGLTLRKGVPQSYDRQALAETLATARAGEAVFPGYSHLLYDVDSALARRLDRPQVLILEGLGLGGAPVDVLVYVDADEADLKAWFTARFMDLWTAGLSDPTSFYARFSGMTPAQATEFASQVWREINLPNVREHILPLREAADIVVRKRSDHGIENVTVRGRT